MYCARDKKRLGDRKGKRTEQENLADGQCHDLHVCRSLGAMRQSVVNVEESGPRAAASYETDICSSLQ